MASQDVSIDTSRRSAPEIFHAAQDLGRNELRRSSRTLAFSGLSGGLCMGLTGLGVAAVRGMLGNGPWQEFVSYLLYPTGFIAVIIGRSQLFTENTLYPVLLVLDEKKRRARVTIQTLRLWGVVFASNVAGAFVFAFLAMQTGALNGNIAGEIVALGRYGIEGTGGHLFWSGVMGGWLIALVARIVTASHWTIGQIVMIWLLTFVVGIGHFAHCIATSCEILSAVVVGAVPLASYAHWLLFATLGNIVGGVTMVSMLNYGQVRLD